MRPLSSSYAALVLTAVAASAASARRMQQPHALRGLQANTSHVDMTGMDTSHVDMTGMDMSNMAMAPPPSMASGSSPGGDFRCPVCGMSTQDMGYNNLNHVGLEHGQIVYTCGMEPRPFDDYKTDHTDTSYLAANVAEFIVNSTAATAFAECADTCDACADGIRDPVTGAAVTTANYHYVCLVNGQKIYFASAASQNEYLSNVNTEPRYLVDSVVCENNTCADAESITELSAAAQAFVPELSTSGRNSSGGRSNASNSTSDDPAAASGSSSAAPVHSSIGVAVALASVLAAVAAVM
ncbi:unnamed protein product [Hyaloperonospora brassicae]|uniref:Uncharacterized protein n=1 Tax=Hyaloperonospora brassicae TaxID=162125 RepID=A0AAV0UIZ1_HYABA|nr:unnamed protein product [Hyaloperonospora brassicae]